MKKLIFVFSFALIISTNVYPQCPDYLDCESQAAIDNFALQYPNCTSIEGYLIISGPGITSLQGLSGLTSVGQYVYIASTSLTDFSGLDNLNAIGGYLLILGNNLLTSLSGLGNLVSVDEYLTISSNGSLTSLEGMENLAHVKMGFAIEDNPILTSLADFENLTEVLETFQIVNNESLNSLAGFISLESLEGSLFIGNFKGSTSLGLPHLKSITGSMELSQNYFAQDLNDFANLTSIGGDLIINKCNALTDLSGLINLASINGSLEVSENNALSSLAGIDSIAAVSISNLNITFNPLLSECDIRSICDYLFDPSGDIEIHSNYTGCNNFVEIKNACTASVDEIVKESPLSLYPNPASTELYITTGPEKEIVIIRIYNQLGRRTLRQEFIHNPLDISSLPPGLYLVEVDFGGSTLRERLVVSR